MSVSTADGEAKDGLTELPNKLPTHNAECMIGDEMKTTDSQCYDKMFNQNKSMNTEPKSLNCCSPRMTLNWDIELPSFVTTEDRTPTQV